MKTEEAFAAVNWRLLQGLRFKPSLEVGAFGLAVDVEGKEVWPLSLSRIGAGQEEQDQPIGAPQQG